MLITHIFSFFYNVFPSFQRLLPYIIFSMTVFGENLRCCYSLGVVGVVVQKLWHFVLILLLLKIYLKIWIYVHYPKSNPYYQGRQFKLHFFPELCPLYNLDLSSIKHPKAEHWHPHAVFLFTWKSSFIFEILKFVVKLWFNSTKRQNFWIHQIKAFADDKLNIAKMMFSVFDRL